MSQVGRMRKGLALLLTMASAVLMGCSGGGSTDVLADVRDSGTLRVALT